MVVSSISINNRHRIFTVLSVDGKELINFYFLEYSHDSNLFCFYNVRWKDNLDLWEHALNKKINTAENKGLKVFVI